MSCCSSSASTLMTSSIERSMLFSKMSAILSGILLLPSKNPVPVAMERFKAVHEAQRVHSRACAGVEEHSRHPELLHELLKQRAGSIRRIESADASNENDVLVGR